MTVGDLMGDALTSDAVFGLRCLTCDLQTESVMEAAVGRKNPGKILLWYSVFMLQSQLVIKKSGVLIHVLKKLFYLAMTSQRSKTSVRSKSKKSSSLPVSFCSTVNSLQSGPGLVILPYLKNSIYFLDPLKGKLHAKVSQSCEFYSFSNHLVHSF